MYCTIDDLKAEAVEVTEGNSARLNSLIASAGEKIDLWLGQFFEPREKTLDFCGHGGRTLIFDVPLLELGTITIDGKQIQNEEVRTVNNGRYLIREKRWPRGHFNITVSGLFGCVQAYVDDGGVKRYRTPAAIREAAIRLVVRDMAQIGDAAAQEERKRSRVVKETTDGHSYELGGISSTGSDGGTWSGDYEIDALLWPFKAPARIEIV